MKKGLLALLIVLVLSFFVSCKANKTVSSTLKLVVSGLQQPSEKTFFRTFVKLFEAEHDASVDLVYVTPEELKTRMATEQSTEVQTDVVMVDTANMRSYLDNGWMQSLDWLDLHTDRTITDVFDDYTHQDGIRYFVPVSWDVYITIYHVDALTSIPSTVEVVRDETQTIVAIDSITWEEYMAWATAIKTSTGTAKAGFPFAATSSQLLYAFGGMALAYGAPAFPLINDLKALDAWNLLANTAATGAFAYMVLLEASNQPTALLDNGTLWMAYGHMGPIGSSYAKNPGQYVLGPAPNAASTGKSGSMAGAWTYGIVKDAVNSELAQEWILFMTEPEINYLYCSGLGGVISPIEEVTDHLGSSNTDKIMKVGLAMTQSPITIQVVDSTTHLPWNDVRTIYLDLAARLWTGEPLTEVERLNFQARLDALSVGP